MRARGVLEFVDEDVPDAIVEREEKVRGAVRVSQRVERAQRDLDEIALAVGREDHLEMHQRLGKEVGDRLERFPLLVNAAHSVASPLIRNFATLGGNINQRPRCWFLRGPDFHCYKKGGDTCFSVTGDNRFHAIIGGELCYIVHPSDTATALLALNAQAKIAGPDGERTVAFDNYFIGPRENVLRENVLKPNELMVEVFIPTPAAGTKQTWMKLKNRDVYDFALVSVAAAFTTENDNWKDGRIVLGGVAPVPYRATGVENQLKGKHVKNSIKQAAATIRTVARPMSMNAYKVDIAQNMVERTILQALA